LATTFGLRAGPVPDRFFVGLATLGLLSEAAAERPLACVVDDAQWLDRASAQVLAFVGRRLLAESVVMLFGNRRASEEFAGLPAPVVEGLRDADSRALLGSVIPGRFDERATKQIVAETRGNPLALLELPRGRPAAELAGGFGLPGSASLEGRIEQSFHGAARPRERRDAHRALAEATDARADPDRRAWHIAKATVDPNEHVAADLERAAGRAQARVGVAANAAFLELARHVRIGRVTLEPPAVGTCQRDPAVGDLQSRLGRGARRLVVPFAVGVVECPLRLVACGGAGAVSPSRPARSARSATARSSTPR
jgi:hypothetical protein